MASPDQNADQTMDQSPPLTSPASPNNNDGNNPNASSNAAVNGVSKRYRPMPAKTFQCRGYGECRMVFSRSEHLARHIRKHTGERPFSCHCGKQFSRLDNLRQHAQTVHSDKQDLNEQMMRDLSSLHATMTAANKSSVGPIRSGRRGSGANAGGGSNNASNGASGAIGGQNGSPIDEEDDGDSMKLVKQEDQFHSSMSSGGGGGYHQRRRPGTSATGYEGELFHASGSPSSSSWPVDDHSSRAGSHSFRDSLQSFREPKDPASSRLGPYARQPQQHPHSSQSFLPVSNSGPFSFVPDSRGYYPHHQHQQQQQYQQQQQSSGSAAARRPGSSSSATTATTLPPLSSVVPATSLSSLPRPSPSSATVESVFPGPGGSSSSSSSSSSATTTTSQFLRPSSVGGPGVPSSGIRPGTAPASFFHRTPAAALGRQLSVSTVGIGESGSSAAAGNRSSHGYGPGSGYGSGHGHGHGYGGSGGHTSGPGVVGSGASAASASGSSVHASYGGGYEPTSPATYDSPFSFQPHFQSSTTTTSTTSGGSTSTSGPGVSGGQQREQQPPNPRKRPFPDAEHDGRPRTGGRPATAGGSGGYYDYGSDSRPQSRRLSVMELCNEGDPGSRPGTATAASYGAGAGGSGAPPPPPLTPPSTAGSFLSEPDERDGDEYNGGDDVRGRSVYFESSKESERGYAGEGRYSAGPLSGYGPVHGGRPRSGYASAGGPRFFGHDDYSPRRPRTTASESSSSSSASSSFSNNGSSGRLRAGEAGEYAARRAPAGGRGGEDGDGYGGGYDENPFKYRRFSRDGERDRYSHDDDDDRYDDDDDPRDERGFARSKSAAASTPSPLVETRTVSTLPVSASLPVASAATAAAAASPIASPVSVARSVSVASSARPASTQPAPPVSAASPGSAASASSASSPSPSLPIDADGTVAEDAVRVGKKESAAYSHELRRQQQEQLERLVKAHQQQQQQGEGGIRPPQGHVVKRGSSAGASTTPSATATAAGRHGQPPLDGDMDMGAYSAAIESLRAQHTHPGTTGTPGNGMTEEQRVQFEMAVYRREQIRMDEVRMQREREMHMNAMRRQQLQQQQQQQHQQMMEQQHQRSHSSLGRGIHGHPPMHHHSHRGGVLRAGGHYGGQHGHHGHYAARQPHVVDFGHPAHGHISQHSQHPPPSSSPLSASSSNSGHHRGLSHVDMGMEVGVGVPDMDMRIGGYPGHSLPPHQQPQAQRFMASRGQSMGMGMEFGIHQALSATSSSSGNGVGDAHHFQHPHPQQQPQHHPHHPQLGNQSSYIHSQQQQLGMASQQQQSQSTGPYLDLGMGMLGGHGDAMPWAGGADPSMGVGVGVDEHLGGMPWNANGAGGMDEFLGTMNGVEEDEFKLLG